MFEEEAKWIRGQLSTFSLDLSPMLNVGSSSLLFRTREQPFIHEQIVMPFEQLGGKILHLDMKHAEGIDLVGDLMNPSFRALVKAHQIRSVLCSNLLEHVEDPKKICEWLIEVICSGGYLLVTVPFRYPYHNDPIDTMFRPDIEELARLFDGCEMINGVRLTIRGSSYFNFLLNKPFLFIITILRLLLPFYKYNVWRDIIKYFPNFFKPFEVTCVVLKKKTEPVLLHE